MITIFYGLKHTRRKRLEKNLRFGLNSVIPVEGARIHSYTGGGFMK